MSNPLKKTMVDLGLADEEEVYDEPVAETPARRERTSERGAERTVEKAAPVVPLHRPAVVRQPTAGTVSEILTVHPKQYRDAQLIAENFRDGIPVIINLSQMSDGDARRLIDFASGLSQGLYGKIERVTSKVFLLSPAYVEVRGDHAEVETDVDASFFPQG